LTVRKTEIVVHFKAAPSGLFKGHEEGAPGSNVLIIHVQPDEGISLRFNAKEPGQVVKLDQVRMDFKYEDYFRLKPSTGYETLLYDVLIGDRTLLNRADNIELGWRVVQSALDATKADSVELHSYAAGSSGPQAADDLLLRDGRQWERLA
jgi:glucose-6-phosphate 1-dehydrogenase